MKKILFVCTGNIFRSMSAEYALKHALEKDSDITVTSAGTEARIEPIHPDTLARLRYHGIDPIGHKQTKVSSQIIDGCDLIISMNTDHKEFLIRNFNQPSILFYEASKGQAVPFPDLRDVYPDWEKRPDVSRDYIYQSVDAIVESAPLIVARLPDLLR